MSSTINASNGAVSGLISTGDASGQLQLQVNNGTPAVTLNTSGAIGVGSSPSYGTSGQVLTSSGSGSAPTWTTPSAGAMTLISSTTASNTSSVIFTGLDSALYSTYILQINHAVPSVNNVQPQLLLSTNNGSSFISTGYETDYMVLYSSTFSTNFTRSYGDANFYYPTIGNTASAGGFSATMTLPKPSASTVFGYYYQGWVYNETVYGYTPLIGGGSNSTASGVNAIKFMFGGANISSGTIALYGINAS